MRRTKAQTERIKENNRWRGETERSDVKALGEGEKWNGQKKNIKKTAKGPTLIKEQRPSLSLLLLP